MAVLASCGLAWLLDPHAWQQYSLMMRTGGALAEHVPTLSATLRFYLRPSAVWLQFLPEMLAAVWGAWYFWSRRGAWDWMDHGLLLLLTGTACAPYGWFTDESLLLPAVLTGIYAAEKAHRPLWPLAVIAGAAMLEVIFNAQIISRVFLWTPLAWLCWFLYSTGRLQCHHGNRTHGRDFPASR